MKSIEDHSNTIIRTLKGSNPYAVIDKSGLNDVRSSWKTKGLLAYLLSKTDNWQVYESDLVKRSKDGRDAVRTGLRELEGLGYMSRRQIRDENGSFKRMEYVVYEKSIKIEGEPADPTGCSLIKQDTNQSNTIIRTSKRSNPYVMIDKSGLNDIRLSWKAKGLLAYLLSKPDDWHVYEFDLINRSKDGRDAVRSGLRELENCGYMSRKQIRDDQGIFRGMEYVIFEKSNQAIDLTTVDGKSVDGIQLPKTDFPSTVNPTTEKPLTDNPPLVINDLVINDLNMIDCESNTTNHVTTLSENINNHHNNIYEALVTNIPKNCYLLDNVPLNQGYIEEIFIMLINQFHDRLLPEIVVAACELYFDRSCKYVLEKGVVMKIEITNPVGYFRWCYTDAILKYKLNRNH